MGLLPTYIVDIEFYGNWIDKRWEKESSLFICNMISLLVPLFTHTKAENEPQEQKPLAIKRGPVENIRFLTLKLVTLDMQ